METIVETIINSIDFLYIILCNVITYVVIESLCATKYKEKMTTWVKRLIATGIAILLGGIMYYGFHRSFEGMFYGFFIQYLSWDYFFKALVERVKNIISGTSVQ